MGKTATNDIIQAFKFYDPEEKIQILKKLLGKVEFFLKNHENDLQFCKISKNKESTLDVEDV